MPYTRFTNFIRSIFDEDIWSEVGKAIAYTIPTSTIFVIFYQLFPTALIYVSGGGILTTHDVYPHAFAGAGLTALASQIIKKYKGGTILGKYSIAIGAWVSALLLVIGWEAFEVVTNLGFLDILKDTISTLVGIASYIGIEGLRQKIKKE